MADDWLWHRRPLPPPLQREALEERKRDYYANKEWPPKPDFDRQQFDKDCLEAEEYIELLIRGEQIPRFKPRTDSRLAVLKHYFYAYANGRYDAESIFHWAQADVLEIYQDNPGMALLALEVAKAGFLAMGEPRQARHFAQTAERTVRQLGHWQQQLEAQRQLRLPPGQE